MIYLVMLKQMIMTAELKSTGKSPQEEERFAKLKTRLLSPLYYYSNILLRSRTILIPANTSFRSSIKYKDTVHLQSKRVQKKTVTRHRHLTSSLKLRHLLLDKDSTQYNSYTLRWTSIAYGQEQTLWCFVGLLVDQTRS